MLVDISLFAGWRSELGKLNAFMHRGGLLNKERSHEFGYESGVTPLPAWKGAMKRMHKEYK